MTLVVGDRLGRYEILDALGAGGMGEVYRARDTTLDRDVAVKVLPENMAQDSDRLIRFEREAKAVARLAHPNILEIWDFGTENGIDFTVVPNYNFRDANLKGVNFVLELINQSPLGTGAGYGIPIKIDRGYTAKLLGFGKSQENPIARFPL